LPGVHPETRYFVLKRGALTNVTAGIVTIPKIRFDSATKSQREKPVMDEHHLIDPA
jgi:hypothetical protein